MAKQIKATAQSPGKNKGKDGNKQPKSGSLARPPAPNIWSDMPPIGSTDEIIAKAENTGDVPEDDLPTGETDELGDQPGTNTPSIDSFTSMQGSAGDRESINAGSDIADDPVHVVQEGLEATSVAVPSPATNVLEFGQDSDGVRSVPGGYSGFGDYSYLTATKQTVLKELVNDPESRTALASTMSRAPAYGRRTSAFAGEDSNGPTQNTKDKGVMSKGLPFSTSAPSTEETILRLAEMVSNLEHRLSTIEETVSLERTAHNEAFAKIIRNLGAIRASLANTGTSHQRMPGASTPVAGPSSINIIRDLSSVMTVAESARSASAASEAGSSRSRTAPGSTTARRVFDY